MSRLSISYQMIIIIGCFFLSFSSMNMYGQDIMKGNQGRQTSEKIGDAILYSLPIAAVGTSLIIGDKKGAWQFTKSLLLTQAVTYGLKYSIKKERPDGSDDNSFPSGHTSTVFHSAGYIHKRYGFKYSIPAYALAGFTAASRVDANKHDVLDVVFGAAVGLGSNLIFTTAYQQEHMELTYSSFEGSPMIGFNYRF